MKKLLIATVMAMIGIVVNAATYDWKVSVEYTAISESTDGGDYTGYLAYFFDANVNARDSVLSQLQTGVSVLSSALGSGAVNGEDMIGFDSTGKSQVFTDDNTVRGYLVLLNASSASAATAFYATDTMAIAVTEAVSSGGAKFTWSELYGGDPSSWTAVPEPTSGLLMLIGLAGLALKRKRA